MRVNFLKTKEFKFKVVLSILLLIIFAVSFLFEENFQKLLNLTETYSENEISVSQLAGSDYIVNYLDVGQGNCCIIELPDSKTMVIDGGSDINGDKICNFLKNKNITTIDYMIATHADVDHIGGLNFLFDKFEIVNIFRPMQIAGTEIEEINSNGKVSTRFEVYEYEDLKSVYESFGASRFVEATSYRYREFIKNVYLETYTENGNIKNSNVTVFYDGLIIEGKDYQFEFFAPLKIKDNIDFSKICEKTKGFMTKIYSQNESNDSSAIFLCSIKNKKFFFSGDATAAIDEEDNITKFEESDFLNSLTNQEKYKFLSVDVYLASHHGSKYGTSIQLLKLINPKYIIFSYGKNTFGHPNEEVIDRINEVESLKSDGILRTEEDGNISFCIYEENLCFSLEKTNKTHSLMIPYFCFILMIFIFCELLIINTRPLKLFDRRK